LVGGTLVNPKVDGGGALLLRIGSSGTSARVAGGFTTGADVLYAYTSTSLCRQLASRPAAATRRHGQRHADEIRRGLENLCRQRNRQEDACGCGKKPTHARD
jgi:hypothetical protein